MKSRMNTILSMRTLLSASLLVAVAWSGALAAEEQVSYKLDVQPILQSRCSSCHQPGGEGYQASGLDLTSYEGLMKGTKYGPIVVPGDPLTSNLMVLVEGRARPEGPHAARPAPAAEAADRDPAPMGQAGRQKQLIHLVRASLTLSLSLTREGASECERVRVKADASVHVRPDLALQRV